MSSKNWQEFFKTHRELLEKSYPGIREQRFLQEVEKIPRDQFEQAILEGVPLQYLNHEAAFCSLLLYCDERVLIPRAETEQLVELALQFLKGRRKEKSKVFDMGTGSGAIALAILVESQKPLQLIASDISSDALEVAKYNEQKYSHLIHSDAELFWRKGDRLHAVLPEEKFDLIVSNPPYIKEVEDRSDVHSKVLQYEPELALFLPDDEYEQWFKDFFIMAVAHLEEGGCFLMEGHEKHLLSLQRLADELNFNMRWQVLKDLSQRDRFLQGIRI